MNKICYVTAFLDLNREKWDIWESRNNDSYIRAFSRYLPLFVLYPDKYEMFVYIDYSLLQTLKELCENITNVHLVPINQEFLEENSLLWRRLPREQEIMSSREFRELMKHRLDYPEVSIPQYNMINHAKIDLVCFSMQMTDADILGWVDFGYLKNTENIPDRLVDSNKLYSNRINFSLVNLVKLPHYNIKNTLISAPEVVEGGFFFGNRTALLKYQKLYHETHAMFQKQDIADDDQHVVLQAYRASPGLFHMIYQGKWLQSMRYFQVSVNQPKFLVYLSGGLGNQIFQIANGYALARRFSGVFSILDKPEHDFRQGNKPEKYRNTIFREFGFSTDETHDALVCEKKWAYQDYTPEISTFLSSGYRTIGVQGFFQSDMYLGNFSDEFRNLLLPREGVRKWLALNKENVFEQFPELDTDVDQGYCFVGVRRTDYLLYPEHNACDLDYFMHAIHAQNAVRYYITSDDIDWCKKNFIGEQYRFFDLKDDMVQFYAGTLFSKYIISNSTFHWWISYLSQHENPTVIAPNKWHGGPDCKKENYWSIYRENMIVLDR